MEFDRVAAHEPAAVTDETREAAVVVPVVTRPTGDAILFTRRADDLDSHPGQMSFPGGGREPADEDLLATALREADEEVCLDADEATIVGRLDDIRTVSRYSVRPFVATVPDREYEPCDAEVAEVTLLPVAALVDPENYTSERRDHPHYGEIRLHFFSVGGCTVWGATARILAQLLELATDWEIPPEPDHIAEAGDDLPPDVRDQVG